MHKMLLTCFLMGIFQFAAFASEPSFHPAVAEFSAAPDTLDPPTCTAAPDITVWCDMFDPSLVAYPGIVEQSADVVSVSSQLDYSAFDTICLRGRLTRTFQVVDTEGETGICSQSIQVNYRQDYYLKFPNDIFTTVCTANGVYGEPTFFGEDCELLGISYEDEIIDVVPDACYRIQRRWTVINWCTYDPTVGLIYVPNPNPSPISNHPSNMPGPIVSPILTGGDPWRATTVKITPADTAATNYSVFYNPNANGYQYVQSIKIIDVEDPLVVSSPSQAQNVDDLSANDDLLWNDTYWWDNANQSHDLCEASADISIVATDVCSGTSINISFLLFLDLDGDGVMETQVNSTQLGNQPGGLGWNNILFNNLNGSMGQSRQFDRRQVPTSQKWGFALERTIVGNEVKAALKFNTYAAPNTYEPVQLPYGTHKIKWFINDACGNEKVQEYLIYIRDRQAPTVHCLNGITLNLPTTKQVTLWASDMLMDAADNCTQAPLLKFGIRKAGAGTGFPVDANGNPQENLVYTCSELGFNSLELWCIDLAGNTSQCNSVVVVQDNAGYCSISTDTLIHGRISSPLQAPLVGVPVDIEIQGGPIVPPFNYLTFTNSFGDYHWLNNVSIGTNGAVAPHWDDNPLGGITSFDLVLIRQHLLGITLLDSPYKIIAADVNGSHSITAFDIVELRKLILGTYNELPNSSTYVFVKKDYVFNNPLNPFAGGGVGIPGVATFQEIFSGQASGDFFGIKVGDVNYSNFAPEPDDRNEETTAFDVSTLDGIEKFAPGAETDIAFRGESAMLGCQFSLNLDGLELLDIQPGSAMTRDQFAWRPEQQLLTVAWETGGVPDFTLRCRATKTGALSEMLHLGNQVVRAEAYFSGTEGASMRKKLPVLRFSTTPNLALYQNQPNPFSSATEIGFYMPENGEATIKITDATGKIVFEQSAFYTAGEHSVTVGNTSFEAKGVLFCQLETAKARVVRKIVRL